MKDRSENRPGYKETKVGWIPDEWGIGSLGDIASVFLSNVDKKSNSNEVDVFLCNYTDVYYNDYIKPDIDFMKATASKREIEKYKLRSGDVIITKDSETKEDIAVSAVVKEELPNLICGYHLAIIRPKKNRICNEYLNKLFRLPIIRYSFSKLANGVTRFGLTLSAINNALIPLPTLPEQIKIAEILYIWDEAIEQSRKLIEAKKRHKKALMQQLLTGKRLYRSYEYDNWNVQLLGDLVERVSRPIPKPQNPYLSIGIRSHGNGTFQKMVEQPEKVMMDTLYRIESNDLIVNITFAWEGAIAIVSEQDSGGLVSHRFPTYRFRKTEADIDFFRNLILTKRFIWDLGLISPGGAGRNRVLSQKDFLKLKVFVPLVAVQKEIGEILAAADKELHLCEDYLKALEKQKCGLMQKLLTGKVRVKP